MAYTLLSAAEELLREIKHNYQETSQISDEHLLGLKFLFGPTALYALDLVDQCSVTHVTSPSGRSTFQHMVVYNVRIHLRDHGPCHYNQRTKTMPCKTSPDHNGTYDELKECKHILAVYISQAIGRCQDLSVSDNHMSEILLAKDD